MIFDAADAIPTAPRSRHGRHGRAARSQLTRPPLPQLESRIDRFDVIVATTSEFLRAVWAELRDVRFEIGTIPFHAHKEMPRWSVLKDEKRIILFRVPLERQDKWHRDDEWHGRMIVESAVIYAAAEFLGKEPWELSPDRFRR